MFSSRTSTRTALIIFLVVMLGCFIGIFSRPAGFLASLWVANAFLLVMFIRLPDAARWNGWLIGFAGFIVADLVTGTSIKHALLLNIANMMSVSMAYAVLCRLPKDVVFLQEPSSVLYLVLAAVLGGFAASLVGAYVSVTIFGGNAWVGFFFWWVTEIANYVAFLPVLLASPPLKDLVKLLSLRHWWVRKTDFLPAISVFISCGIGLFIGGPGAIAFPVLALLWCALVYPVFATTLLTLFCSLFAFIIVSSGYMPEYAEEVDEVGLFSIRLGAALIAIAPVMLSVLIQNHKQLVAELRYLTTHDSLTKVGSRIAFHEDSERILREVKPPHAVLMLDLDHFKSINDTYGHAVGDHVLKETAHRISQCLRPTDRIGRMGGEEFAVFLRGCSSIYAKEIAERIRIAVCEQPVIATNGTEINVTISIGLRMADTRTAGYDLDRFLSEADAALYRSKENGRNRVEVFAAS